MNSNRKCTNLVWISLICFTISSLTVFLREPYPILSMSASINLNVAGESAEKEDVSGEMMRLIRPQEETAVVEPEPGLCHGSGDVNLAIGVFTAPANLLARETIRSVF